MDEIEFKCRTALINYVHVSLTCRLSMNVIRSYLLRSCESEIEVKTWGDGA